MKHFYFFNRVNRLIQVLVLLFFMGDAHAQVSTYYTFSKSDQAYRADTSATTNVPASIFGTAWDDNTYTGYKFPFTFNYKGTTYTAGVATIGIDTDGWMAFSTTGTITMTGTTAGGSWVSFSNTTGVYLSGSANNDGICGFNSDLEEQSFPSVTGNTTNGSAVISNITDFSVLRVGMRITGTGIPNGAVVNAIDLLNSSIRISIAATTTGTAVALTPRTSIYAFLRGIAPYRQFVVQWTAATRFAGSGGDDFSFQIVLNEGGGDPNYQTLQAVYGVCKATNTTPQNAQVGLRGSTAADFNARKTNTDWSATVASTANTDVCVLTPAINPSSGLTFTWSPACLAAAGAAGALSGPLSVCPGTTVDYSIPGVPGATFYNWTYTGTNTVLAGTSTLPLNTLAFDYTATGGTLTVTPGNGCGLGTSSSILISMNGLPTASIGYPLLSYCTSASPVSVTRTGTAGGTYTASPAGLSINASTGQVTPSTSTPGTYTVTYSFVSGCSNIATTAITINPGPALVASASPASICIGGNSNLTANVTSNANYTVSSIPYALLTPSGSPTNLYSTYNDDAITSAIALPFGFTFYGSLITQFHVSTNGHVQLQTASGSALTPQTLPNATTPNNIVALCWDDLVIDPSTHPGALIRYFVNGTSPNQVLVIDYQSLRFLGGTSAENVSGQIRLYQSDNHIEVAVTQVEDDGGGYTKTLGIENATGTIGITPPGRNNVSWNVSSSEAWAFYPPVVSASYSWTPATYLSNTTIANPVATGVAGTLTYTVTATNTSTGCAASAPVTVSALAPLSGTYTVGVAGNFTTLTDAINAYNAGCIGGPVVFSLISANYSSGETFPLAINRNSYASATNTLTIRPASGVTATVTGSVSGAALIKILGDYITIDGSNNGSNTRNLTIANTNTTTPSVIHFGSTGTTPIVFSNLKNCLIENGSKSASAILVGDGAIAGNAGYFKNITLNNNRVRKAYIGIYCRGVNAALNGSGLTIINNDMNASNANAIQDVGIYVQDVDGATLSKNSISNLDGTNSYDDKGIWLATGVRNTSVLANSIHSMNYSGGFGYGPHGIYLSTGVANANIRLAHNMIANLTGDGYDYTSSSFGVDNPTGILLTNTQSGIQVFFNSIHLYGSTLNSTNAISVGIRLLTGSVADIRNNIIVNNLGRSGSSGYGAIGILAATSNTQFSNLNYNDYFINPSSGNKYFGQIATTGQTTLAGWRTATTREAQGVNISPVFTGTTDLHLVAASNGTLSNLGTAIAGITLDYDSTTRNGLTPDLGADEFLLPNTGSWVGKTSTDWLINTNWETNSIPDGTTDVSITGGYTFMPAIATTQAVRDLNLSAPVPANTPVLTLNGGVLQINRTITRTGGSIEGSNGTVEMTGTAAQTVPAGLFVNNNLKNLVIGNTNTVTGVTLAGTLDIYRSLTFTAGGKKLTTGNFLTFKSTATETAWLGDVTGKTIVGDATVERYIPTGVGGLPNHGKTWQFLAAPVNTTQTVKVAWQEGATLPNQNPVPGYGTQITSNLSGAVALGFDVYTAAGGASMKTHDPGTSAGGPGTWVGIANTNSLSITNAKGYMVFVRGNRSVTAYNQAAAVTVMRAKGKLYTASVGELPPVTTVLNGRFASIGNPYASAINFTAINKPAAPLVDDAFYVWDPLLAGSYGFGDYQLLSAANLWKPIPGGTANYNASLPYTSIQSGQAFLVHATGAGGNVSFTEGAKITGSQLSFRTENTSLNSSIGRQYLRASLYAINPTGKAMANGNVAAFDGQYQRGYTHHDALKMPGGTESFGIRLGDKVLSLEARPYVSASDTIFYVMENMRKMNYEICFAPENMQGNSCVPYLIDRYLQTQTLLSLSDTTRFPFTVNNDVLSAASDRFVIVFRLLQTVPVQITKISAIRLGINKARVNWELQQERNVSHYVVEKSADGLHFLPSQIVQSRASNLPVQSYQIDDLQVNGLVWYFQLRTINIDQSFQISEIVKIPEVSQIPSLQVAPNPILNASIHMNHKGLEVGTYSYRIINVLGQMVCKGSFQVNRQDGNVKITPDHPLSSGIYELEISGTRQQTDVLKFQVP